MGDSDPVLFAHEVSGFKRVYDTGSIQTPGSIRDQILRSSWLVDRALNAGKLGPGKSFLVVGGGPGGVSAALRATAAGVPTTIVDPNLEPFSRQRACHTRWIDPTVYEWPLSCHSEIAWGERLPLPYSGGKSSEIVRLHWDPPIHAHTVPQNSDQHNRSRLSLTRGFASLPIEEDMNDTVMVSVSNAASASSPATLMFANLALWAPGPPRENTRCGNYVGFHFWESDPYDQSPLLPAQDSRIVVSGGGDGALQDILRFVFDPVRVPSPRLLAEILSRYTAAELLVRLLSVIDHGQRTYLWSGGSRAKAQDCALLSEAHEKFREIARHLSSIPELVAELRGLFRQSSPKISFVHACSHFAKVYPLNQLLVLVLIECAPDIIEYIPGFGVSEVLSQDDHTCGSPATCHGRPHAVSVRARSCVNPLITVNSLGTRNIVVVRHGPEPAAREITTTVRRQVLPYRL